MMSIQDKLVTRISDQLNLSKEEHEIIAYGAFVIMQILLCTIAVAVFGLLFGVMLEALVVSFSTSILRQYSGGAHASRPGSCAVIGTVVSVGLALLIQYIGNLMTFNIIVILGIVLFLLSFYIVHRYAPVDSQAKPIKTEEKRKKMRKKSFSIILLYLFINVTFLYFYQYTKDSRFCFLTLNILGGMLFQIFSLTIIGRNLLAKVDYKLTNIMYRR